MNPRLNPVVPWYRHRWPWLLMLGPFVVVVAGGFTAWLAFRTNDGLVADDYYKQGLAINQVTARVHRAAALHLSGQLTIDPMRHLVRANLDTGSYSGPDTLLLTLSHPTRGELDQSYRLQRDSTGGYSAAVLGDIAGRWYVVLEDEAREWRLAATWDLPGQPVLAISAVPR